MAPRRSADVGRSNQGPEAGPWWYFPTRGPWWGLGELRAVVEPALLLRKHQGPTPRALVGLGTKAPTARPYRRASVGYLVGPEPGPKAVSPRGSRRTRPAAPASARRRTLIPGAGLKRASGGRRPVRAPGRDSAGDSTRWRGAASSSGCLRREPGERRGLARGLVLPLFGAPSLAGFPPEGQGCAGRRIVANRFPKPNVAHVESRLPPRVSLLPQPGVPRNGPRRVCTTCGRDVPSRLVPVTT